MATLDYNLGSPLGPDPRAVSDLAAIDAYVRTQARPRVKDYPKSIKEIEAYEKWRQALGYWDMMVMVNDTMRAAKAKRDAINVAQNNVLPEGSIVEEGAFVASPDLPRGKAWWLVAGLTLGLVGGGYAVLKLGKSISPARLLKGS